MDSLPSELITLIAVHLSARDVLYWALTSRRYYRLCRRAPLLRQLRHRNYTLQKTIRYPMVDASGAIHSATLVIAVCTACKQCTAGAQPDCARRCDVCKHEVCKTERTDVNSLVLFRSDKQVDALQRSDYLCALCLADACKRRSAVAYRDCWDQERVHYLSAKADRQYRRCMLSAGWSLVPFAL